MSVRAGVKAGAGVVAVCLLIYVYIYNISSVNLATGFFMSSRLRAYVVFNHNTSSLNTSINASYQIRDSFTYSNISRTSGNYSSCLITLFSTWTMNAKKEHVWKATLKNWAYFRPHVRPVFFVSKGMDTSEIEKYGWDILPITKEAVGLPVLKQMFVDAMNTFNSTFYGFANGDIIFDPGLITTLKAIVSTGLVKGKSKPVFVSGIRTNVPFMTEKETDDVKNLARIAKKRGKVFISMSEDYFITDAAFPWKDIADVVIARRAYDNWLLLRARQLNTTVIDATQTLVAVHQTTSAGNSEHQKAKGNKEYNVILLRKLFKRLNYGAGATVCAGMRTTWENTTVRISSRAKLNKICSPL